MTQTLEARRADFPVLQRRIDDRAVVYLDSAATSLKPRSVIDAVVSYYERTSANIHRGKHFLSEEASEHFEVARRKVAQFIGAMGNEVVFVRNTTEALNVIAHGLPLQAGDRVLTTLDAHHSLILPWRRRAEVDVVPVDAHLQLDRAAWHAMLEKRPKVVALNHCSNVTGRYFPVEQMAREAHAVGALVVLDAAQSIPHRRIDVSQGLFDFVCFSSHKMLGPTGIGVLFGKAELLETLEPTFLGGGTVDWVELGSHRMRKVPHRLEAGTPHIAGAYGLGAAVDYLEAIGPALERHDRELSLNLRREAAARPYLETMGGTAPEDDRAAIVSLRLAGISNLGDVARALSDSYGIMCRSGHLCAQPLVDRFGSSQVLRISAYLYSTAAEVSAAFAALDELHPRMSGSR